MTTHELARHLLKMADIKVNVLNPDQSNTIETIQYAVGCFDKSGQQNAVLDLRGESYQREVMRTMQTPNAKANILDRAKLINPGNIKAFEEYTESFKALLVKRYNWSVKSANEFKSFTLKDYFEEGLSIQDAYYKYFEIPEEQQEFQGTGKDGIEAI